TRTSYIVQAGSLEQAFRAATDVGGNITHELSIINAVGADLSASQVQVLRQMEGVKVLVNGKVNVTSTSQTFVYDDNVYPIEHFASQGSRGDACLSHPEYERIFDVSDNFIIDDLNVGIDVEHNAHGDLRVNLTSPAGTTVTLVEQDTDVDYRDNYNFYLDDEATGSNTAIHDGSNHGITNTFERNVFPDNALSAFDGQQANGTWTLAFCNTDVSGSTGGRILHYGGDSYGGAQLVFTGNSSSSTPPVNDVVTIRDEFDTESYSGSNGILDWVGPWVEVDNDDVRDGNFSVENDKCADGHCLEIETDHGLGEYVYREVDLQGASWARLSYAVYNGIDGDGREVVAEISADGGNSFTVLRTYNSDDVNEGTLVTETIDVSAYIGSQTQVRFRVSVDDAGNKRIYVDDVQFEFDIYMPEATHAEFVEATMVHDQGTRGSGVTVAVVDTGYWPHPALDYNSNNEGRVLVQYDAILDQIDAVGLPTADTDDNGHGTYVTSVLLSSETSGPGKSHGVAPMANLVSVKAFGADGSSSYLDVIRGIDFIVQNKAVYGIKVVNLSFGSQAQSLYWQ
ncbi:MAG: S8 family serine peptidase, partial [Lysobacterales bacterium]